MINIILIIFITICIISIIINAIILYENIRKEKLIKKQKKLISNLVKFRKERKNKK